ncbi:MAG: glycosyltransferase family 87 protein [Anaerolineae bacterium]|jgi:hypothetical protein
MRLAHRLGDLWRRLRHLLADRARQRRLLLAYCVSVILAYIASVGLTVRAGILPWARGDFVAYYTGARILRDGHAHRLYDLVLQARVQQQILRPHGFAFAGGLLPYNYPPFLAAALVPLSFLSLRSAFLVWDLVNVGLILGSVALLVRERQGWSRGVFLMTSLMVLAFFPVLEGLVKGQSTFAVLFALALAHWALKRHRGSLAGAALALGLVKPHLVALIVIYLLYRRKWRAVAGFGVTGALLLVPPSALVGLRGLRAYGALLRQQSRWDAIVSIYPASMPNVRGTIYRAGLMCDRWFGVQLSHVTLTAAMAVLSLAVLVPVFRSWRSATEPDSDALDLQFALTLAAGLWISPHLRRHDLSLLVLVGWLVSLYAASAGRSAAARGLIAAGHVTPLILPSVLPHPLDRQVLAFLLLSLVVVLVRWAVEERARRQSPRS